MTPIKMKDGRFAYPIKSVADLHAAQKLGCDIEFTACGDGYNLPGGEKLGSGGWIHTSVARPHAESGHRLRGVLVGGAKPTPWQRIKGWFA